MGDNNDSESTQNKEQLQEVLQHADNAVCADCGEKEPLWTSANLGLFICIICAGIHRNLGTHISRVKSIMLDSWKPEEIELMRTHGNKKGNEHWQGSLGSCIPIRATDSVALREQWIKAKYVRKLYQKRLSVHAGGGIGRPSELPTRDGWMIKKGDVVKSWKKRYFKLVGSLLFYYRKVGGTPAGHIFMVETTRLPDCLPDPLPDRPFCFTISTPNRDYYLCADSGEDMYDWVQMLRTSKQYLSKPSSYGNNNKSSELLQDSHTIDQAVSELSRVSNLRRKLNGKVINNCIHASLVVDYLIHMFRLESRHEGVILGKVLLEKGHLRPAAPSTVPEAFADKSDVLYVVSQ